METRDAVVDIDVDLLRVLQSRVMRHRLFGIVLDLRISLSDFLPGSRRHDL